MGGGAKKQTSFNRSTHCGTIITALEAYVLQIGAGQSADCDHEKEEG